MARIVLFGNRLQAEMYHYCFSHDSAHEVVAFTVDGAFIDESTMLGLPVVPFESLVTDFPPEDYALALPIGYQSVNRFRAEKYLQAKQMGYACVGYLSSKANVWEGFRLGDNTFVHDGVCILPYASVGTNVIVGNGAIVGHHVSIGAHCFIAPGAAIMGGASVGGYSLIGANATIRDGVTIGERVIVGAGALLTENAQEGSVFLARPSERLEIDSEDFAPLLTPLSG